jgi:hypothetical protein
MYPADIGKKSQMYVHKTYSATVGFTTGTRTEVTAVILSHIDVVSMFQAKCPFGGDSVC